MYVINVSFHVLGITCRWTRVGYVLGGGGEESEGDVFGPRWAGPRLPTRRQARRVICRVNPLADN